MTSIVKGAGKTKGFAPWPSRGGAFSLSLVLFPHHKDIEGIVKNKQDMKELMSDDNKIQTSIRTAG